MNKLILLLTVCCSLMRSQSSDRDMHRIAFEAHKNFIGKSEKDVRSYWETKISSVHFVEQSSNGLTGFSIIYERVGNPELSAIFRSGKCLQYEFVFYIKELSIVQARLKSQGFVYNKKDDVWENKAVAQWCNIEHIGGGNSQIMSATYGKE